MEQLLVHQVNRSPTSPAVIDGALTLSYAALLARADRLTKTLTLKHIGPQEPICIFLEPGHRQVTAQVAVLRAGGTCVPVDPSMPQKRLGEMLRDIEARLVITSEEFATRVPGHDAVLFDAVIMGAGGDAESNIEARATNGHGTGDNEPNGQAKQAMQVPVPVPVLGSCPEQWDHRSHILFTSGSTGKPKAVQISASSILHLATRTPVTPLQATDRVAELNNPGFDLSLFEIWVSLLSGATIVVIPKHTATDPFGLRDFIHTHGVSVVICPTALFGVIASTCPEAFGGVRHVLVCGEAPSVKAVRDVLTEGPPGALWNGYGPTECTTFVTLQLVDLAETGRESISIGRAVGETVVYLLDEEGRVIGDAGRDGEIYLGGPGLSRGYLNRPEGLERFVEIWPEGKGGKGVRVFRTGDMGRWRVPLEVLDFKGRFDMQVKQDGFRVELGDVERTLETMDGVRQAVVLQQRPTGHKVLSAYLVLADESIRARDVKNYAKESLPPYMVPSKITIVPALPLNPYGKVDREALARISLEEDGEVADGDSGEMSSIVKRMVRSLIHVADLQADDDFFELGMSSLESARLIGLLMQRFGKKVTMDMLLENPTVAKVASMLQETKQTRPTLVDIAVMQADTLLADDIPVVPDWLAANEGRVFITGVTGFVGVHLLAQLLALPGVQQIACLARSRKGLSAQARVEHTLKKYNIWAPSQPHMSKLLILDGEMADESLGLGPEKFTWLTTWASVVFHVGAKVNFCEPYASHFASNVLGTKHVLRLAALGRRKALHYMSSIDTWGPTALVLGTKRLEEDEGLHAHLTSLPYDTGYAHSQWVAEEMVRRTRDRGLPVAIYRPGFTIGDPSTAMGNPDDFFARLIVGSIKIGFWPYLPDQRLEYVTVDYVCSALLHIASNTGNLGKSYSLVAPEHKQSVSIEGTGRMLNEAGYAVKEVPYDEWVVRLRESDIDRNPLSPLMPLLEEPVLWELSRLQTSKHTPVYAAPNTVKALGGRDDIRYTPLSSGLLGRYLESWRREGFYDV
ncbi:non-ribosomal peptide synthetase [Aspergillus mulundensis]|uniref:Carrier domain-containing protein n=1 Tax=Aspergillus mulundensis TaxID=1810919 RepID=A0A3D8SWW4_9EURO|nr:Uncharacterized protein DSM5745_02524 [Aspergillus mulundensis]RDW90749.1 Uncharacterized protein DSM5745_02524 [Aspergillus mulundensis]